MVPNAQASVPAQYLGIESPSTIHKTQEQNRFFFFLNKMIQNNKKKQVKGATSELVTF